MENLLHYIFLAGVKMTPTQIYQIFFRSLDWYKTTKQLFRCNDKVINIWINLINHFWAVIKNMTGVKMTPVGITLIYVIWKKTYKHKVSFE